MQKYFKQVNACMLVWTSYLEMICGLGSHQYRCRPHIIFHILILGTHVEDNLYVFRHRVDLAVAYSHATLCMANINYGLHVFMLIKPQ